MKTGTTNKGKAELNRHKHVTDPPPPGRCVPRCNSPTGVRALEAGAEQDTGEASRVVQ